MAWDACSHATCPLLQLMECYPGTAAWIQAAGVIAALGVTIWLSRRDAAERKQKQIDLSFGLVESLVGAIMLLDNEIARAQKSIATGAEAAPNDEHWEAWFSRARLDVPATLTDALPLMRDADPTIIGPFRRTAMMAQTFNGYVGQFEHRQRDVLRQRWAEAFALIQKQVTLLRSSVDEAKRTINSQLS